MSASGGPDPAVRPVRRVSLAREAHASLRDAIRTGTLTAGRVYSEADVAARMGVSRTPVREALGELSRDGVVEVLPQRGFRLRVPDARERDEVLGLRLAVEGLAVETLARAATAEQVAELRTLLSRQAEALGEPGAFLDLDEALHLAIPRLAGLARTEAVLRGLRGATWLVGGAALAAEGRAAEVVAEHEAVVDAIEARDARRARAALRRHLERTGRSLAAQARERGGR